MAASGLPPGFEAKSFEAQRAALHYVEGPRSGTPLVLLHGLSRDWRSFQVVFEPLTDIFHVFALDLRGHGDSGHISGGYRVTDFADDVCDFLEAKLPGGAAVFGHSLGGMVALSVAARLGSAARALVIGDSAITPASLRSSMYYALFSQLHSLLLQCRSMHELSQQIADITIQFPGIDEAFRLGELPGNDDAALREWARSAILTDPEALAMMLDNSSFADWLPEQFLPRISCPVLLLQGNPELDAVMSDSDVQLAKRLVPKLKHVQFPLLGHALFMQQAKPVLDEIVAFLSGPPTHSPA